MLVVGAKEEEEGKVSVRSRFLGDEGDVYKRQSDTRSPWFPTDQEETILFTEINNWKKAAAYQLLVSKNTLLVTE